MADKPTPIERGDLADQMQEWAKRLRRGPRTGDLLGIASGLEDVARDIKRHGVA